MGLPVIRRSAVRLVVVDEHDRVLLLRIREPRHPEQGTVWELPGGGLDGDETYVDAARRELREEAGIVVGSAAIGPPTWRRRVTFQHAGARRVQDEVVVTVRLGCPATAVDASEQQPDELETYLGYRWWTVTEVETSSERFFPGRLPLLLRRFLSGEPIEEPFEHFS
jgi:8-oxo-dGTP pyrophosphatase MutT (NUDIX family)